MKTVREVYFLLKKIQNKYINDTIIKELLFEANGFKTYHEFVMSYNDPCKNTDKIADWLERIMEGKPMQYVFGHAYFLGLKIKVNPDVLIPRPETEELVTFASKIIEQYFPNNDSISIYDVCSGSGAISLALKDEFKEKVEVVGSDISSAAVKLARENAKALGLKVKYYTGDMLKPLIATKQRFDVIVSNPPYIEDISTIDEQVLKYEPHEALLASPITKYYEKIFKSCYKVLNERWLMIFEINESMTAELEPVCLNYFNKDQLEWRKDMCNRWRYLIVKSHPNSVVNFDKINEALNNHGVIAFPTETVCGLGVSYDDLEAIEKLNRIKGHRNNKPYTMMLGSVEEIEDYAYVDKNAKKLIDNFMPGDITLLLKRKTTVPDHVTLGSETVGIRVPDNELTLDIINHFGKPLLVPSANKSDEKPTLDIEETKKVFGDEIDFYVDGKSGMKKPSTIVSLVDGVKIIRQGDIEKEEILSILKEQN